MSRTIRFEIRVAPAMEDRVDKAIAAAGLSPFTLIAEECSACHEEWDECICDDDEEVYD